MKKKFIVTGLVVVLASVILYALSTITSRRNTVETYIEVQKGTFEINVSSAGELLAERSMDIKGPEIAMGRDIRFFNIKIQDLIPEGTVVREGDYVATLDRTDLNNNLKDAQTSLNTLQTALDMKLLDTAVVLNDLRDQIKNQVFTVKEAAITLRNSKYEPAPTIRSAEIALNKAQRTLEQLRRSYTQKFAQNKTDILNQTYWVNKTARKVKDLEEVLSKFTIIAPSAGMVIYKKDWSGTKRKVGSMINPFDRVVATLPDLSSMLSKTYINEIDISKMKTGQNVAITVDAFPLKKFNGNIIYVANIGEKLQNSNDKVFEVQVRIEDTDPSLRPSMTTGNKIIIKTVSDAVYVPIECVQAGSDSIPYVYTKDGSRQIVLLGESNEKNVMIEKGLDPGTMIYLGTPKNPEKFSRKGEELVSIIREREKIRNSLTLNYSKNKEEKI